MTQEYKRWSPPRDPDDDAPRLECGVFGIFEADEAAALIALGLTAPDGAAVNRFKNDAGLRAAALKAHYGLPLDDFPTLPQATDALAWKLLGLDTAEKFSVKSVLTILFNRELGPDPQPDDKVALRKLAARRRRPAGRRQGIAGRRPAAMGRSGGGRDHPRTRAGPGDVRRAGAIGRAGVPERPVRGRAGRKGRRHAGDPTG